MKFKTKIIMKKYIFTKCLVVSLLLFGGRTKAASVHHANLPGPLVYVVTPSAVHDIPSTASETARYYSGHAWPQMATVDPPIQKQIEKKSDLIFAEFEKDDNNNPDSMKKSIWQLLEKEKIKSPSPEQEIQPPPQTFSDLSEQMEKESKNSTKPISDSSSFMTTTTTPAPMRVEDIWHVINNEKSYNTPPPQGGDSINPYDIAESVGIEKEPPRPEMENPQYTPSTESFYASFPAHNSNTGENESRAIQSNFGFPYVNLNTIQMKNRNKFQAPKVVNKNGNSQYYNLGDIQNEKFPGKGEAQDATNIYRPSIDRYNPAQPYLPSAKYGPKESKPSPAPPPPPPKSSYAAPPQPVSPDFALPSGNYESFPPYPPSMEDSKPPPISSYVPPPAPSYVQASPLESPPTLQISTAASGDILQQSDMDSGYSYNRPTPPPDGNIGGYSYNRPAPQPPLTAPTLPPDMKPSFPYLYKKPSYGIFSHDSDDFPQLPYGKHHHDHDSSDNSNSGGSVDMSNAGVSGMAMGGGMVPGNSYGPQMDDVKPDYPELVFSKHHPPMDVDDGSADMRPPPPPAPTMDKPSHDDHAHPPPDFEPDFKYHDFGDYDHYHHHHHPTTTTTEAPTTEMPRVNNRFSYYYLGKKLYYLPLYFSIYFIAYVGALIIKAVLRHKITYPQHWRERRSLDDTLSHDSLLRLTGSITNHIMAATERYGDKDK